MRISALFILVILIGLLSACAQRQRPEKTSSARAAYGQSATSGKFYRKKSKQPKYKMVRKTKMRNMKASARKN